MSDLHNGFNQLDISYHSSPWEFILCQEPLWNGMKEDSNTVFFLFSTRKLMEIESRLLPCGLHIVGVPPSAEEAVATLVNIAEIDRPDNPTPLRGMPRILAESVGKTIDDVYAGNNKGVLEDVALLERITEACRSAVSEFVQEQTDSSGRVSYDAMSNLLGKIGITEEPWIRGLKDTEFTKANKDDLRCTFEYLQFCLEQVIHMR